MSWRSETEDAYERGGIDAVARLFGEYTEAVVRKMTAQERLDLSEQVELPYSEVCVHMRVAGQTRPVVALAHNMAWILEADGRTFSAPITRGEAGL